jgi:hypothetical protein
MILRIHHALLKEGQGNATNQTKRLVRQKIIQLIKLLNQQNLFQKKVIKKGFKILAPVKNQFHDQIKIYVMFEPRLRDGKGWRITYGHYNPNENHIMLNGTFETQQSQIFTNKAFELLNDILEHELRHWWQNKFNKDPKMDTVQNFQNFYKIKQNALQGKNFLLRQISHAMLIPYEIDSYLRGTFIPSVKKLFIEKKRINNNGNSVGNQKNITVEHLWIDYLLWIANQINFKLKN